MLVVLVSECVSSALSAQAKSVANALVAVGALLFWSFALDRLAHRWPWFERLLEPRPVPLVEDGKRLQENLDAEGITDEELRAQLREHGIDGIGRVKSAILESEGNLSVIPKDEWQPRPVVADGTAEGPEQLESAVRKFLAVAGELQAVIAWHEERAADHRAAAKLTRELLTRHGIGAKSADQANERINCDSFTASVRSIMPLISRTRPSMFASWKTSRWPRDTV
jgi:uncharacterized protein DUF421